VEAEEGLCAWDGFLEEGVELGEVMKGRMGAEASVEGGLERVECAFRPVRKSFIRKSKS